MATFVGARFGGILCQAGSRAIHDLVHGVVMGPLPLPQSLRPIQYIVQHQPRFWASERLASEMPSLALLMGDFPLCGERRPHFDPVPVYGNGQSRWVLPSSKICARRRRLLKMGMHGSKELGCAPADADKKMMMEKETKEEMKKRKRWLRRSGSVQGLTLSEFGFSAIYLGQKHSSRLTFTSSARMSGYVGKSVRRDEQRGRGSGLASSFISYPL